MYDIAIIGAGPAGATLARIIGKQYRVLLVDRRNLSLPSQGVVRKCCGGLLAPDAQKVMGMMGLALPQSVIVGPQLFVVRTVDLNKKLERYYQRFYINVDREKFDRWLVSLVPPEVELHCACLCKGISFDGKEYALRLLQHGKEYTEHARVVIGADGANSLVRKGLFAEDSEQYVAIQEWFRVKEMTPHFSVFFDSEITDFYAWSIPKEEELLVGAALTPGSDASRRFAQLKQKLSAYGYPLELRTRREGAMILRPRKTPRSIVCEPGAALIGEAAGWISPSSAEGFSYAFRSALAAADSLSEGIEGFTSRYVRETADLRRNILVKNLKLPMMYHPWLRSLVMNLGIESVKIIDRDD